MTQHDWNAGAQSLGLFLNGDGLTAPGPQGERVEDDSFLLLFNASQDDVAFNVPSRRFGRRWMLVFDTADPDAEPGMTTFAAGEALTLVFRSLVLLRRAD
jgi:glycogen operon protein